MADSHISSSAKKLDRTKLPLTLPKTFRDGKGFSYHSCYRQSKRLVPSNSYDPEVHPIASVKSKHIDELVSKQKAPPKRASRGRGGRGRWTPIRASYAGYTPRPPLQRRPQAMYTPPAPLSRSSPLPPAVPAPKVPNEFMQEVLWSIVKKVAISRQNGIYVNELENELQRRYNKEDLNKVGLLRGSDLLQHTKDMVRMTNEKVYPNTDYKFDKQGFYNSNYSVDKSHQNDYHSQGASNCIPAPVGVEEEGEEEYYDEYEDELNDESFWNNDEEYISQFTIERCTKLKELEENNNKRHASENKEEDEDCSPDDHESQFSKKMISNFRLILDKNPDGVWTSELVQKYKEYFFIELELQNLGYTSAINMAVHLPNVFSYERIKTHDWKLYDARKHYKPSSTKEKPEVRQEGIPVAIIDNIRALVRESGSIGIKSTHLLEKYQMKYKKSIDIRALGCLNLEVFLIQLEQQGIFTLRKMDGFYHIQKKHELIPLQDQRPTQVTPAVINPEEAVSIHIPEFVCRLGTRIEPQQLPEINMKADPNEPLLEIAVKIGEIISPEEFYLMLDTSWNDLECLMEDLKNLYVQEEKEFRIPLPYVSKGLYCAVQYQGVEGDWHRAQTVEFAEDDKIKVDYIDYGTPETVKRSEIRFLHTSFASLPAQAIRAKLSNIRPSKGAKRWPMIAKTEFLNLITEKRLIAHVYKISTENTKERMQLDVILYDTSRNGTDPLVVNEYLVEKGFAEYDNHEEVSADQPSLLPDRHISSTLSSSSASASTNNLVNYHFTALSPFLKTYISSICSSPNWRKGAMDLINYERRLTEDQKAEISFFDELDGDISETFNQVCINEQVDSKCKQSSSTSHLDRYNDEIRPNINLKTLNGDASETQLSVAILREKFRRAKCKNVGSPASLNCRELNIPPSPIPKSECTVTNNSSNGVDGCNGKMCNTPLSIDGESLKEMIKNAKLKKVLNKSLFCPLKLPNQSS